MIGEKISIELAKAGDAKNISIFSKNEIEYGLSWHWREQRVYDAIFADNVNVIVAKSGDEFVGFGIMRYFDDGSNIDLMGIKKEYRRLGVGGRIVRWLEKVACVAGISYITVQAREKNYQAAGFYQKLGFEIIDKKPGYYCGIETGLIFSKNVLVRT